MTELVHLARRLDKQHALSSKLKRFDLTVVCVLSLFIFLYYVDVACVIVPWFYYSVPGVLNLMVLTATTATALVCYFNCMFTDPGRVPKGFLPDDEQQAAVQEVKKKDGSARYCKKCSEYKPPRSHHCRVCERCVLRMDHHCPWVNNCIGHANYRSFFLLLVYSTAALIHTTCLLAAHAMHIVHSGKNSRVVRVGPQATAHVMTAEPDTHLMMHIGLQTFAFFVALPTTIAVFMLLIWHIRMVAGNKTTIEAAEGVTAQIKAAALGQARAKHPYDLGIWANIHEIMGEDAFMWLIPSLQPTAGGLNYPTAFEAADIFTF